MKNSAILADMIVTSDLHIHSLFSMATSPTMTPGAILEACSVKGIDVIGSGDALHPTWRAMWEPFIQNEYGITVIPTTEVQAEKRTHHLIMMETFDQFEALQECFEPYCSHITTAGRPHLGLTGGAIAAQVHDLGGLVGPAHAFTPWTGMYGHFDSVSACYGGEPIDFLELGLSADSSYGAGIRELEGVPFLSNSDAHSPQPTKLGREFTRFSCNNNDVRSVLESVAAGNITMNAGFFPEEGKYNRTACSRCFVQYPLEQAEALKWRCPDCGGRIKIGVRDTAFSMHETAATRTPRPPYLHIIPLAEIIQAICGTASPTTKACCALYERCIETLGTEISILTEVSVEEIATVDATLAEAVRRFREGEVKLHPGGGGKYGSFSFL